MIRCVIRCVCVCVCVCVHVHACIAVSLNSGKVMTSWLDVIHSLQNILSEEVGIRSFVLVWTH